ncbi:uncharacterized protein LOC135486805 isoform X3 [Lineus longissimus]
MRGSSDYDELFKITIIGTSGVGKSSLVSRFVRDAFTERFISSIGIDFLIKSIHLDDKVIKLQIWDTAGQERFRAITSAFYRGSHGIVLVYDVTSQESFNNIRGWNVDPFVGFDTLKLLIGNKSDLTAEREVEFSTGKSYADELGIPFFETSAKDSMNVERAFVTLAATIDKRRKESKQHSDDVVTRDTIHYAKKEFKTGSGSCCGS